MKRSFLYFIVLALLTSSCSIGLNISRKTPEKAYRYPNFTEADSLRGMITPWRACYDVNYYDISLSVDPDEKSIEGDVELWFTVVEDMDTLQIDLYENMHISSIKYQGTNLQYFRKYNAVFVVFGHTLKAGEQAMITVSYDGKPQVARKPPWEGGFVWKTDKNKLPWIGVACEVDGASLWWPMKDHLSDEPDSLRMHVTVPDGLYCVSNGVLESSEKKGDKETFNWKVSYPINTYNVTIYLGEFSHFSVPYVSDSSSMTLDYYVLPYNLEKAEEHFLQTNDILEFYETTYGAYPWIRDGFKLVEGPFAGMEHQSAIAYGNEYKNAYHQDFDYIILHESAHEWWGNSVSAGDYADVWLHEGFATYSEALYVEKTKGYDAYLNYLSVYSIFIKNKMPLIGPFDVNFWDYKDTDVYMKGALMLHTLRNVIAYDSLFFNIIRSFYQQHKYSITKSSDFTELVNEMTGSDYGWFFDLYLRNRLCPALEYSYVYYGVEGIIFFKYRWTNIGDEFKLPVTIRLDDHYEVIYPGSELKVSRFKVSSSFLVNPNNSYIAVKENKKL